MENLWLRATRAAKLVDWTNIGKLEAPKNHFDEMRVRCYVSRATNILFKDPPRGSSKGPAISPCTPKFDSGSTKTSNETKSIYCSESSKKEPKKTDTPVTPEKPAECKEPCPRDCKLSPSWRSDSSSGKKTPSSQPPVCPPTEDYARKMRLWKRLTIFGAVPVVLIASIMMQAKKKEEARQPRPKFVPMDYMYRRTKRFPWGDGNHSLFHNPIRNAVPPDGYEVEDPNEVRKHN